ncbi:MAG TPA: beta-N-acetylhexosaminidase [Terriglobales bacterium]
MLRRRDQLGELLIPGFEPAEMTPRLRSLLASIQPAGVILFARNIVSPEQTHRLLADCRACVPGPIFTCVDLEGGRVDRFRKALGPAPAAADVFASGDRRLFRKHGRVIGDCCRALGFNTDLAPVLDLALEASRAVMSSRAVSANPRQVAWYAREFLKGLASAGVIGAGKHFPGLGEANLDTHAELPSVSKSLRKMWGEDLVPYRLLRRELPMVLVGHANYSAVTKRRTPASLSKKWISEVLRKKIGYRGLVISDDLEMGGVLKAGSIEHAAVGFVRAGGDLCLVCHQEELVTRAYEALIKESERDVKFRQRAEESVKRVLEFKKKSRQLGRKAPCPTASLVQKLRRQLWEFGEEVRLETIKRQVAG